MRKLLPIIWVMLCALPMSVSAQQIFIWEGATSSDWNVGANWLTFGPGVYPNTPTDIVLIIPAVNNPQLFVSDITVGNIIATFGASVDLNDFTLTIGGGNITGATVSDGRIVQVGSSALNFSGSTLSDITFDKSSSSVTNFQNGNTINFAPANHFRMLPGAGSIQLGVGTGDTFTGNARFINNSNSILTIGFEGASIFDGDVILEQNTPLGEIIFGAGAGTSTLANGYIDGTAIHDGTLYLGGIIQQNVGVSSIIGSAMMGYPHTLDIENSEFAGDLVAISLGTLSVMNTKMEGLGNYLEAPEITEIKQSFFVNTAIKKNITALASDVWFGGNKYDNCTVVNESSFDIRLNAIEADTFYNQAAFDNIGSGLLWIAAADSSYFAGNIIINNTSPIGIVIGNITAGNRATIAGNIKTTGYNNGPLELSRVDQLAATPNDTLRGTGLFVRNSRVRGDFSYLASGGNTRILSSTFDRTNIFRSPNMSQMQQSTFSPVAGTSTTFLKTGPAVNAWFGGNTFGNATFVNSANGNLSMANTDPDIFNGKATFRQTGATGNLTPCSTANCLFRDTISTLGTIKKIIFGGPAAGNAIIDGNSAQVLQGDAGLEPEFRRLVMNTTGILQLDIPLNILTSSTFTNGRILSSSTNPVIYATTAVPPATGSNASHVDGPIRRGGTGNFRFVTGDNGKYAPVEIIPSGAFGIFEVEYFNASYSSVAVDGSLDHVSTCEYWDISRPGAGDPVDLTMTWDDVRSCGINDLTSLTVAHWNGAMWTNMPVTVIGALPSGTITVSGVSSFSPFTLASTNAANPLPIELLYFDAQPNGKAVNLLWATATEQNNDYFSIERSRDGVKFDEILRTPGAGNSTERKDYSEVDTRPLSGLSYYRLRQTDFNGETTVSQVVAVRMEGEDKDIKVFPNPADDFFFVETSADLATLRIRLLNHIGQTVPLAPQVQAGRLAYNVNGLPAGVYYIEVQQDKSMNLDLTRRQSGLIAVVAAAVLWSTGGLFIKLLPFDAQTILFYRSACAALMFGLLFHKSIFKVNALSIGISIVYAGLLFCFVTATKLTTAANAIFLQYTAPIYVLLLEPVLFKTRLQRIDIITILVCLGGMALFFSGDLAVGDMRGNWIALLSGVLLAGIMLGQRFNSPERYETAIFWGNILVMAIAFPTWKESPAPDLPQWGMLLFLGFIQIGTGYMLFNYGLKRILAVESALLAMLEPILNPVWVFLGYGERPGSWAIAGGLMIVLMLMLRTWLTERRTRPAQAV